MSDNKTVTDGKDASKIDMNDASEVEYVHSQFPNLKHQQVVDTIRKYGPSRETVYEQLRKQ